MTAVPADTHDPLAAEERVSLVSHLRAEAATLVDSLTGRVQRVEVSAGDCSISVEWAAPTPVGSGQPAPAAPAAEETGGEVVEPRPDAHPLRAPLVGSFYRCPAPDAEPFVAIGDRVETGQTVAIIEAMKLMNEIKADRAGRVVAIHPADGQMVEFDEVLVELSVAEDD